MRILAIPVHEGKTRCYQSEALAARAFHTDAKIILNLLESGEALRIDAKHSWCFDEPLGCSGRYTLKCVETGEVVTLNSSKEFCEWSGYKSNDILTKGSGRIVNRNDGKTYKLVD